MTTNTDSINDNWLINGRYLIPSLRSVSDGEHTFKLGAADYCILEILLNNLDKPVSREQLFEIAWEGKFVSEARLTQSIFSIRLALGDDGKAQKVLKTIAKSGYMISSELVQYDGSQYKNEGTASENSQSIYALITNHKSLYKHLALIVFLFVAGYILGILRSPGSEYLGNIKTAKFVTYEKPFPNNHNIDIHLQENIEPISLKGAFAPKVLLDDDCQVDIYILENNSKYTYVFYSLKKQMSINFEANYGLIEGLTNSLWKFHESTI